MNYLSVSELSKSFGEFKLFRDVSFGLDKGQKVGLVAKNGAGKSTLFKILMGKEIQDECEIDHKLVNSLNLSTDRLLVKATGNVNHTHFIHSKVDFAEEVDASKVVPIIRRRNYWHLNNAL